MMATTPLPNPQPQLHPQPPPQHQPATPGYDAHLPIPGLAAICTYTRPIATHLKRSTPAHSSSPLATLIYHVPHSREPAFWVHPRMFNAAFTAHPNTHAIRPVHVAALRASWTWFGWLVSRPPGSDFDATEGPIAANVTVSPDEPLSTRAKVHVQMQANTAVRVPALADLRAVDDKGWNLMHYAVLGDAVEYVRWFKEGGTWDTYLPRLIAVMFTYHEQVARDLCAERELSAGLSPLDVAIAVGAEQDMLFLLERGLVPTVGVDFAGRTPLHHVRHAAMLMLLLAVHPVKTRRWMQVLDTAGMPAWVYAIRLAPGSEVLDIMTAYLDVVYEDGGMWLPGSEFEAVRDMARASIVERVANGELAERDGKLIMSWTNREAIGISKENEWALASEDEHEYEYQVEQPAVEGDMYDSDVELPPPPPPYEPPQAPPAPASSDARPSSSASSSAPTDPDTWVQVNQSHAPCPFPNCKYSSTPLHCDRLSAHLAQAHWKPRSSATPPQCSFPGCFKTVSRVQGLKRHVIMHAPADMYACAYAPGTCTFTNATRRGVRFHVQLAHLANASGKGKEKAARKEEQEEQEGDREQGEADQEDDEWEVWEEGISSLGLEPPASASASASASSLSPVQRQVARKSMGSGRYAQLPRGFTPAKIEVEVPLFVSPPRASLASVSPSTIADPAVQSATAIQHPQLAREAASPMPEPEAPALAPPPHSEPSIPVPPPPRREPTSAPAPLTSSTTPLDSTISEARTRQAAPTQPQPSTAISRAPQQDDLSSADDSGSDDDIMDVTPVQLQPRRPQAPPAALTWPAYLPTLTAPRRPAAESNVVVISDSDDDADEGDAMAVDEPAHPLLTEHAVDDTHPLAPLALTASTRTGHPPTYATPSESSTFWAAALKHIRDSPALHASLARQYLPPAYTGPSPHMYMHRASGRPFISLSSPDSASFTGYLLVPVPAIGAQVEDRIALAVGACALPAGLLAVLAQATRTHYVDRVRRPLEVLRAATGDGVYFVVSSEQVEGRADELVGRHGMRPTGVHVPPIVDIGVEGEGRRALVVVVRKKVLEWFLLGLGYVKPGEEARGAVGADPLVVWY